MSSFLQLALTYFLSGCRIKVATHHHYGSCCHWMNANLPIWVSDYDCETGAKLAFNACIVHKAVGA